MLDFGQHLSFVPSLLVEIRMIRPMHAADINRAISIWYFASILAHHFIPEAFWLSQKEVMRDIYLPNCEAWVYEHNRQIVGFIAYRDGIVAALFVDPSSQSQGIGSRLLCFLKKHHPKLSLAVYKDNMRALGFYVQEGFVATQERTCEHTGCKEILMEWASDA